MDERPHAQGRMLAKLFNLPDDSNIGQGGFTLNSADDGSAILSIKLVRSIDAETVDALVNGRER